MVKVSFKATPDIGVIVRLPPEGGMFTFTVTVVCEGIMYVGSYAENLRLMTLESVKLIKLSQILTLTTL